MAEIDRVDKKAGTNSMLPTREHFTYNDIGRLKMNGWEKIHHVNSKHKKMGEIYEYRTK